MLHKKELHFVLGAVGGSGKTLLASQLADARCALTCDINPTHNHLMHFKGLSRLKKTNNLFHDKSRGGHEGNYSTYTEEIVHGLCEHFSGDGASSVVVDMDGVSGVYMLKRVINREAFREIFDLRDVSVYYHIVLSSVAYASSKILVTQFSSDGTVPASEKSVVVWFNSYSSPFNPPFDMCAEKKNIEDVVGKRLRGFVHIGDDAEIIKGTVSRFFTESTFSEFEKSPPEECDRLRLSRIRQFDREFKEKIQNIMDTQVVVETSEHGLIVPENTTDRVQDEKMSIGEPIMTIVQANDFVAEKIEMPEQSPLDIYEEKKGENKQHDTDDIQIAMTSDEESWEYDDDDEK